MPARKRFALSTFSFLAALAMALVTSGPAQATQIWGQCDTRYLYGYPNEPVHAFGSGYLCHCEGNCGWSCHSGQVYGTCESGHFCGS